MENTLVTYLYRDAANYKAFGRVVLAGELSAAQVAQVQAGLTGGGQFLPAQVGLPTLQETFTSHFEDDHVWHELGEIGATDAEITPGLAVDAAGFAAGFVDVVWDVAAAEALLEEFVSSTPTGK